MIFANQKMLRPVGKFWKLHRSRLFGKSSFSL